MSSEAPVLRVDEMTPMELRCLIIQSINEMVEVLNTKKPLLRGDLQRVHDRMGLWVSGFPETQLQ